MLRITPPCVAHPGLPAAWARKNGPASSPRRPSARHAARCRSSGRSRVRGRVVHEDVDRAERLHACATAPSACSGSPAEPANVATSPSIAPRAPAVSSSSSGFRDEHADPGAGGDEASAIARPMPQRRAGDERDLAVEADVRARVDHPDSQVEAGLAARSRPDAIGVDVALPQDAGTPRRGSRPRSRRRARTARGRRPRRCARSGRPATTSAQTRRRFALAVAGIRMPAAALPLAELVGRLHEQAVGRHADRLLRRRRRPTMHVGTEATARPCAGDASMVVRTLPAQVARWRPPRTRSPAPGVCAASELARPSRSRSRPGSADARRVRAYFLLTKPRVIELLLVTTVPAMVLAADELPSLAADRRGARRRRARRRRREHHQLLDRARPRPA